MKEINFIPEWYVRGRTRRKSYQTQNIILACVFGALLVWSFASGRAVSKAKAQAARQSLADTEANAEIVAEYDKLKNDIDLLRKNEQTLEKLDNKINVSALLAEISHLLSDNIVLSKIDLQPASIDSKSFGSAAVTIGYRKSGVKFLQEPVPYKLVLTGIATGAADVATLISKLESSLYFRNIVPGTMKNKEVKQQQATEFEISCYLANYIEQVRENTK